MVIIFEASENEASWMYENDNCVSLEFSAILFLEMWRYKTSTARQLMQFLLSVYRLCSVSIGDISDILITPAVQKNMMCVYSAFFNRPIFPELV